jgi:homocitrate synthase NifV
MLQNCKIIDTTLREGEQAPGIIFSLQEKKLILDGIAAIGIQEAELGISSPLTTCLPELIKHCRNNYPQLRTAVWSRCRKEDISYAATLQPDIISLSIPTSDLHLCEKLQKNRTWAKDRMVECVSMAKTYNIAVSVGFEDGTRADPEFLIELAVAAEKAGASRIRIADTVGTASPGTLQKLIATIAGALTTAELGVHTHNDFGMATANAIAALENGAIWADATVLGLGERCGCARLEELTGYLGLICNNHTFDVQQLRHLAQYVASLTSTPIEKNRPLLGDCIFTCETGLHLQGLQKNPNTYEPYDPTAVGAERKLLFGAKTGRNALAHHMSSLGQDISEADLSLHVIAVREAAHALERPLTSTELRTIISTNYS